MGRTGMVLLLLILLITSSGCLSQKEPPQALKNRIETLQPENRISEQPKDTEAVVEKKPVEEVSADYTALLDSRHSACIKCHGDVKPFHTVNVIRLIDEKKGINPRLCTVCHGQKIHNIHWASLEAERIICDTCHTYQGGFVKPKAMEG